MNKTVKKDRVDRLTLSDAAVEMVLEDHAGPMAWSTWVHGLFPSKLTGKKWYTRDDAQLRVLKGNIGGVYEIGIRKTDSDVVQAMYVGRTQGCTKASKKGVTLRHRIFSEYCLNGSHNEKILDTVLSSGYHVWFRWCKLPNEQVVVSSEAHMLASVDWPWNKMESDAFRGVSETHPNEAIDDETSILLETLIGEIAHLKLSAMQKSGALQRIKIALI
jgi:GIY-YIG domain-containing protein